MAAGIRATDAEIVAFVDSDSVLEEDAMRVLVQGFAEEKVGAICGHADVLNIRATWLTRMQAVRYFVAFKVLRRPSRSSAPSPAARAASPPTAARRSCPTSTGGRSRCSSASSRRSATTAR